MKIQSHRQLSRLFITLASVAALSPSALADTWVGSTSADWSGSPGTTNGFTTAPTSGFAAAFGTAGAAGTALTDDLTAGFSVGSITFNAGASSYTISGNSFTLNGTLTNSTTSGTETISDAIALGGTETITGATGGTTVLSGAISGSGDGLSLTGTGAVTLSGNNTYTGTTSISGGIVNVNSATALGAGSITLGGGTLDNTNGSAVTLTNNQAVAITGNFTAFVSGNTSANNLSLGTGAVTEGTNYTITLGGTGTTLAMGTLTNTATGALLQTTVNGSGNTLSLAGYNLSNTSASYTDILNGSANVAITGTVANGGTATGGALTYSGTGNLTLSGSNTFSGVSLTSNGNTVTTGLNLTSGTVTLASTNAAGTAAVGINGGTLAAGSGGLTLSNEVWTENANGTIGGSNALTLNGLFLFGGGNTITVNNSALTTIAGGIDIRDNGTTARTVTFAGSGTTLVNSVISNGLGGAVGSLTYAGTGTLTLDAANTFTGGVTVSEGTVDIAVAAPSGSAGALGNSTGVVNLGVTGNTATPGIAIITTAPVTVARNFQENFYTGTPDVQANASMTFGSTSTGTSTFSGTLGMAGTNTFTAASGGEVDFTGAISNYYGYPNATGLLISGAGLIKITNTSNSFGGNGSLITLQSGTLNLGATATNTTALGNSTNAVVFNGGTLQFSSAYDPTASRTVTLSNGGGTIDTHGNAITFAGVLANTSGNSGGLTLSDSAGTTGSLMLSGSNTYTGGTTVNAGTLVVNNASALGSSNGQLTVNTAGALNLNGFNQSVDNFTGSGGSVYNNGSTTNTLSIGTNNGTGGIYNGVIKNNTNSGAGVVALTKNGTGTITLNGANTYTGATAVNGGTLVLGASGSLGGTAVTLAGGGLQVGVLNSNASATIGTSGNGSLTINSGGSLSFANGVAGASSSAIDNLVIGNAGGGTVLTLGGGGAINFGVGSSGTDEILAGSSGSLLASLAGTTTINLNLISALPSSGSQELIAWGNYSGTASSAFSIGTITGNSGGPSLSLSVTSTGLFLNETSVSTAYWKGSQGSSWATGLPGGNSNFTTDAGGTINRSTVLDSTTSVTFNATGGTNYANTTLDGNPTINNLTFNVGGVGIGSNTGGGGLAKTLTITASGSGITVNTGLGATTETISSNVAIAASQTWTVNDALSNLAVSGNISGAGNGLNKAGNGSLILSGSNNTYSGATSVLAGALNIQNAGALSGTSGITVNSGAALQLSGSGFTTPSTSLGISGTGVATAVSSGVANGGALENVSGNNTYAGAISLNANASIGSDAGLLTLNAGSLNTNGYTLTLSGAGNGELSSVISSGALTMSGTGTWTIDGANTYTGTTTVNSGTLQLGSSGSGALGSYMNPSALTMNGGKVDLNGNGLIIGNLTGSAGTITNNSASSEVTLYVNATSNGTFGGSITNGASGTGLIDLIYNYTGGPFTAGTGITTLTGTNTFTGTTGSAIYSGALRLASNGALGTSTSSPVGLSVITGAALQLSNNITTAAAVPLYLDGAGLSSGGALENVSGNNTYTGAIELYNGPTLIGSDAGSTLNLSSTATITGATNLTLVGSGNGVLAGAISLGSGSLTVASSGTWTPSTTNTTGTWTLSAPESYNGTYVTNGTLAYTSGSVLAGTGAITLGSTTSNTTSALTYAGSGETVSNALNITGSQTVVLGNTGTGAVTYSATPAITGAAKTLVLGNTTDTFGGSIGGITDGSGKTSLTKTGAINSTWILTGTNSYTGVTTINGGVLQIASASALPGGNLNLTGSVSNAVLQTSGTLNLTTGTNLTWGGTTSGGGGFSALGGTLNLNINNGGMLTWGTNLGGVGGSFISFGSSTSNAQVILPNAINLNTNDPFNQSVYVAKGVGGDSTLFTGAITGGTTPTIPGPPIVNGSASGLNKAGAGTLILSNGNSSYTGYTTIESGTLVAEASSAITAGNTTETSTGVFGNGWGPYGTATATAGYSTIYVGTNQGGGTVIGGVTNPTLMIGSTTVGGSNSISNAVLIDWSNNASSNQVFGIGGYSDANATFSGLITLSGAVATGNTFAVTQVATTGTDALNITGGITATNGGNINFANVGAVNVGTTGISNGGTPAVSVTQSGAGTTTFSAANTYTGPTSISGGKLRLTGSLSTGLVTVGGFSGGLSTATLSGTGTVGGALTTSSANSNVAHLAAGANTSGNFGGAGTLTVAGALTIGSGTNLDIDLGSATTVGGGVNDLILMTGTGTSGLLTIGGTTTVNINTLGTITAGSMTSNYYTLISGATSNSGLVASNFNIGTLVGTTDSAHFFVSGNNLDVYFSGGTALQSFTSPSPSPLRIMAGATTTVSAMLANTATAGNNALNVSLADSSTGSTGSVTAFSGSNPTGVAAGTSSSVSGTFTAGSAGTGTWGITNTDATASPTSASTGGNVTVYSKSLPSLSTGTATFGTVHQGATVGAQTTNLQNGAGAFVAGLQITSLGGLTNTGGQSLLAQGTSNALSASVSTGTAGAYSQTYTVGTSDDQTIVGWSANSGLNFTVTGQVYSGQGVWNTNGSGSWGAVAAAPANWTANGGTPGLDAGFTTTDSATFGSALTTGTANVTLDGDSPSLNAITFNDSAASTSYNIGQGSGGMIHLNAGVGNTATITDSVGKNTISAPVELDSNSSTSVANGSTLTLSGVVSSSGSPTFTVTGPGTTVLSNANTYTGATAVNSGKLLVTNTSGSATGTGSVTVNSSGVLAGNGIINGAGVTVNGGGSLVSGARSQISGTGLSTLGGMTLAGTTQLTVGSGSGTANLTFDLGSGTSGIKGGTASGPLDFSNPNNNTTYLSLTGSSSINFAGNTSISLVDLTNTNGTNGALALTLSSPYLLIHAASNADYFNLVINSGTNANPVLSLSQNDASVNGYVLGVWAGGTNPLTDVSTISIAQFGADGTTPLVAGPGGTYPAPTLYLDGGNLEVVPEPGTWALMIGGLALLVFIQRRRNKLG